MTDREDREVRLAAKAEEAEADAFEKKHLEAKLERHRELVEQSRSVFRTIKGAKDISTPEDWQALVTNAAAVYESGAFLAERMGANRFLDPEMTAVLGSLRDGLLAEIPNPTAADYIVIDSIIIAYRNMLRVQGWIDDSCLVVERELFGQAPLNEIHGPEAGQRLIKDIKKMEMHLLPLLERCQKMINRGLARLEARRQITNPKVSVSRAEQVNVGSAVQNN